MWTNIEQKQKVSKNSFLVKLLSDVSGCTHIYKSIMIGAIESVSDRFRIYCEESVESIADESLRLFTIL